MGEGGGSSAMPLILPVNYNYVYKGDDFEVSSNGLVYRMTSNNSLGSLDNVIGNMNLGLDLKKFSNMKVNNIQISEDRQFGYSLYIDFIQNTFSINMNWEKWPTIESANLTQLPPDSQILAISDKFLANYGIDMGRYAKGEIMQNQGVIANEKVLAPETGAGTQSIARPIYSQYVSVVYPLMIDGQEVYDQGGQKYGLTVGIDLGYNRVTNVYNIITGKFESSKYDIESDPGVLIKAAEEGGLNAYNYYYSDVQNSPDIELGSPKQGLVMMWKTEEGKANSIQLFVPSLIFPVRSNQGQNYFYQNNVIVPLVGGIMDQNGGGIRPLLQTVPSPAK
jgi:hypothetical protein